MAFDQGRVFDYFDELRKIVDGANADLLFVDAYMNAEFLSRYLLTVPAGISVRLLANTYGKELAQAAKLFREQQGVTIEVRTSAAIHDRYVFVDGMDCYQSGASFKDGAKEAPTTLTQVLDAFEPVRAMYEGLWQTATVLS